MFEIKQKTTNALYCPMFEKYIQENFYKKLYFSIISEPDFLTGK